MRILRGQAHTPAADDDDDPRGVPVPDAIVQATSGRRVLVSINQAEALTQVSRRTIYNWLRAGRLQYVRTAGGSVRIFEDTLFRPAGPRP